MGPRDITRTKNLSILNKIKQHKEILFSRYTMKNKGERQRAWALVTSHARALGLRGRIETDINYVRDIWWQNAKKATMMKLERAKKPGCSAMMARRWTEFDDTVLAILDQKSTTQFQYEVLGEQEQDGDTKGHNDPLIEQEETIQFDPPSKTRASEDLSFIHVKMEQELEPELNTKTELEMELLRLQVYKARLEARQLELTLGLPRSTHTRGLPASATKHRQHRPRSDSFD